MADALRVPVSVFSLVVVVLALAALWLAVAAAVVGARLRDERHRRRAARAALQLSEGSRAAARRRDLLRLAEGDYGRASFVAARELVRRNPAELLRRAQGSRFRRTRALRVLARGRHPLAVHALDAARRDGRPDVLTAVVALAGELDTARSADLLVDMLVAGDHSRSRIATELETHDYLPILRLQKLLSHADPAVRYWALMLLRRSAGNAGVHAAAIECVDDPDAQVRSAAARLLGESRGRPELLVLRRLLADDVFFVRARAARAVGDLGADALVDEVAGLLADESWWVRAAARESLLALGAPGYAAAVASLEHDDRFARDSAAEVILASGRLEETFAAAGRGDRRAEAQLRTILAAPGALADAIPPALLEQVAG